MLLGSFWVECVSITPHKVPNHPPYISTSPNHFPTHFRTSVLKNLLQTFPEMARIPERSGGLGTARADSKFSPKLSPKLPSFLRSPSSQMRGRVPQLPPQISCCRHSVRGNVRGKEYLRLILGMFLRQSIHSTPNFHQRRSAPYSTRCKG